VTYLLDANVLLALCWEDLKTHRTARAWFSTYGQKGWSTCGLTETAFLRLSMNPKVFPDPATFREALAVLTALRQAPGHRYLDMAEPLKEADLPSASVRGHRQVVDASLLAIARHHDAQLVSFDTGLAKLASDPNWRRTLVLLG